LDSYSDFHAETITTRYVYTPVEDTEGPFSPPERAGLEKGNNGAFKGDGKAAQRILPLSFGKCSLKFILTGLLYG